MTVSSEVIEPFLNWNLNAVDVPLLNGLRIQIIPTFEDLYRARRHQYAAFIASEALLVVWDDEPTHLLQRARTIEAGLLDFVWKTANDDDTQTEKGAPGSNSSEFELDEETGLMAGKERPILLYNCFLSSCALCLITILIGLGYVNIADDVVELHKWTSLSFILMTPVTAFLGFVSRNYFSNCTVTNWIQVLLHSHYQRRRSNHWPRSTSYPEFKILLRCSTTPPFSRQSPTHHHPMPRLQRRPRFCHRAHRSLYQEGHLNLRAPRRHSKHLHQRRWSTTHLR
jgi:hypothetical protein